VPRGGGRSRGWLFAGTLGGFRGHGGIRRGIGHNVASPGGGGGEDAVIPDEGETRPGDERGEPFEEGEGFEHHLGAPVLPLPPQLVQNPSVGVVASLDVSS
jgi:hypothetical protein